MSLDHPYFHFSPSKRQIARALRAMTLKQANTLADVTAYGKPYEVAGTIRAITYRYVTGDAAPVEPPV